MKSIQTIVQTTNEKQVSYIMLGLAASVVVLFVVYISTVFSVTYTGYSITKHTQMISEYQEQVAGLENEYHIKKRTLTDTHAYNQGFAKMDDASYVSVDTKTYSLAR